MIPEWSRLNASVRGFKYYWFDLKEQGESKSSANLSENTLTKQIDCEIQKIVEKSESKRMIYTRGGNWTKAEDYKNITIEEDIYGDDEICKAIDKYLVNLTSYNLSNKKAIIEYIDGGKCWGNSVYKDCEVHHLYGR